MMLLGFGPDDRTVKFCDTLEDAHGLVARVDTVDAGDSARRNQLSVVETFGAGLAWR